MFILLMFMKKDGVYLCSINKKINCIRVNKLFVDYLNMLNC